MASGIVDTLMLSSVPDGVGAAGAANTYIGMFFFLLNVIPWGVLGCMFALTLDECARGVFLFFVWQSRRWKKQR